MQLSLSSVPGYLPLTARVIHVSVSVLDASCVSVCLSVGLSVCPLHSPIAHVYINIVLIPVLVSTPVAVSFLM